MNAKYQKYINYIVSDIEAPYFKNMRDSYGLSPDEYKLVLSKVFNQTVSIMGNNQHVYGELERIIYSEYDNGYWQKHEYDNDGNRTYLQDSYGFWSKYEYDANGNEIYYETSDGFWEKWEYDDRGNLIYNEDSDGNIDRSYR